MEKHKVIEIVNRVRETKPLIHNMTNIVVANFTANGLLALGASPVMASYEGEVADMAKIAGGLLLNIGTIHQQELDAMIIAGKSANVHQVPVVFDPVGIGATPYRTIASEKILQEVNVSIIRGNLAEISQLIGEQGEIKGVDGGEVYGNAIEITRRAAEHLRAVVIATGKDDIISDGTRTFVVHNGHPILTKVTGTGCLLSSVVAAFAAVERDFVQAAVAALIFYGVVAEVAAEKTVANGTGSFQIEFLNQLSNVSAKEIEQYGSFEQL
ncbi:hydroxyethylthiazole kinase [Caldibacillus lycopersici]|uniref:Hydroxyethylthiazole kinase n=1 Tax=Perspicuibacillus lycopersici TaxID=1325689 RepID=A0AAE3IVY3_9BACI|nr:hydroxyethylthiazole kinase [Perspicuibacillus lycopersici]MCU9614389.1 hydroxyethylthiazole kinase [Perspicuibacillus lycopersici]